MLHLLGGSITHILMSIIRFCLTILLYPVFFLLALFYVILHSNRNPGSMPYPVNIADPAQ
jgi:hypothetical protein